MPVIPASVPAARVWIPAFAGMTVFGARGARDAVGVPCPWVPAFAGMTARGKGEGARSPLRGQATRVPFIGKLPKAPAPTLPVRVSPAIVATQSSVIGIGTVIVCFQLT